MTIVVAYDGSNAARAAVSDLQHAGLPQRGTARIVTVTEIPVVAPPLDNVWPGIGAASMVPSAMEEARRITEAEVNRAAAIASSGAALAAKVLPASWMVRHDCAPGPPYRGIVEKAIQLNADLVVVGAQGHSAFSRLFLGSVSQKVLSHSPCSVRIGRHVSAGPPRGKPLGSPLRVLVCTDGSSGSVDAVRVASQRNWPSGAQVRLATVVDLSFPMLAAGMGMAAPGAAGDDVDLSPFEQLVRSAGDAFRCGSALEVTTSVLEGDPKRKLLNEAEEWGADCIFLGAQGHSALERFLVGSVSAAIAARAGCSVEVVRTRAASESRSN